MIGQIRFDTSRFERGLAEMEERFNEGVRRGLAEAAGQLLNDAVQIEPTAPIVEGYLRSTGSYFVNNQLVGTSPMSLKPRGERKLRKGMRPRPNTNDSEPIGQAEMVAVVGFNTPYAAYLHEGMRRDGSRVIRKYTERGSGRKFLESKMSRYHQQYLQVIAENIKAALK